MSECCCQRFGSWRLRGLGYLPDGLWVPYLVSEEMIGDWALFMKWKEYVVSDLCIVYVFVYFEEGFRYLL